MIFAWNTPTIPPIKDAPILNRLVKIRITGRRTITASPLASISETYAYAKKAGIEIDILNDPVIAAKEADVIYTDVWTSMGQEKEQGSRVKVFRKYQINQELVKLAKPDYIFMHCLPAHRVEEVTGDVIDGPQSVVIDEAENRLHAQKGILSWCFA